jgi:hypothetical protein
MSNPETSYVTGYSSFTGEKYVEPSGGLMADISEPKVVAFLIKPSDARFDVIRGFTELVFPEKTRPKDFRSDDPYRRFDVFCIRKFMEETYHLLIFSGKDFPLLEKIALQKGFSLIKWRDDDLWRNLVPNIRGLVSKIPSYECFYSLE